jgi:hypothetical protein
MVEYWMLVVYLSGFFGAFAWHRRLILAAYDISYAHYGIAVLEALILAKVILVGDALRLGRRLEDKPLIVPTLYSAVVFSLWVGVFIVLEHTIEGVLRGQGWAGGVGELLSKGKYILLARCLIVFVAFIPFFAFRELERVLGRGHVLTPFFRERAVTTADLSR